MSSSKRATRIWSSRRRAERSDRSNGLRTQGPASPPVHAVVSRGAARTGRAPCEASPPVAMVEGHVPYRRRLLFDARLSARHRVSGSGRALANRDAHPRSPDAVGRPADLQARGREQPSRAGQHLDARRTAAPLARQGIRPRSARICGDRLRHHDHAVGRRCHRAHRGQSIRASGVQPPGRADAGPAQPPGRRLPEGVSGSNRPGRGDRRDLPGA